MTTDLPGWGQLDVGDNSRSGFDIEMMNWLASQVGFKPNYVDVTLSERETALAGGPEERRVHIVAAAYSMTDSRRKNVTFVGPYMITRQGIMVREGDSRIKTVSDLKGKTVCTGTGTTSLEQLKSSGVDMTIIDEPGLNACAQRLLDGETIDAVSTDQLILAGMAQTAPERLHVIPDLTFGGQERYGLGLPLGDVEDCKILTEELQNFMNKGYWAQFFKLRFPELDPDEHKPNAFELDRCA
ncbi:glutamate transport system substrate-binding protein [Nonomuraea thailandensis]|uniref:Glutamate transport system substrate-binding protein n=1 Tax=Nonomuraea thailandensis TaxID=1188745 RepID=A0A9X2GTN2_9ACTN|nr:transporter substrate-binding domain-containing protein [Nonomuraea thailandensis]MCP2363469.1 glutamate transport system substrate-binding protein [Nonomuraea thailandensis]